MESAPKVAGQKTPSKPLCRISGLKWQGLINKGAALYEIRAVAGQRSSPDLCFATKYIKSMTKDIDLNVTQVGRDGTA